MKHEGMESADVKPLFLEFLYFVQKKAQHKYFILQYIQEVMTH